MIEIDATIQLESFGRRVVLESISQNLLHKHLFWTHADEDDKVGEVAGVDAIELAETDGVEYCGTGELEGDVLVMTAGGGPARGGIVRRGGEDVGGKIGRRE